MVDIHIGDNLSRRHAGCKDYISSQITTVAIVDEVVKIINKNPSESVFDVSYADYICNRQSILTAFEDAGFNVTLNEGILSFTLIRDLQK